MKTPSKLIPSGIRLGMSEAELLTFADGVLDADFVPRYKKASVGPQMTALNAELAEAKAAFRRSKIEFGDQPTQFDNTPFRHEYAYRDGEAMMQLRRGGVTRYFFLAQGRLWKFYDVLPIGPGVSNGWCEEDCGRWTNFADVSDYWGAALGVKGRPLPAEAAQFRLFDEVDWMDGATHVRLINRSGEAMVGLVFEDRATAERLATLRAANGARRLPAAEERK